MKSEQIRSIRVRTLRNMALNGSTYDDLLRYAMRNVSRKTAEDYIEEVRQQILSHKK